MDRDSFLEKIGEMVEPVVQSEGFELVDLQFMKGGKQSFIRIFIDKEGGITLDDCQNISSQVGALLDVEDIIDCHYILEVSSPGLDRPLKKEADFIRCKGKMIRLFLRDPLEKRSEFSGKIIDFKDNYLILEEKKVGKMIVPFEKIKKAQIEIEF
jgi:ribosome maturation factor RimP